MTRFESVDEADDPWTGAVEAPAAVARVAPAAGEDVDPVPIGDPDEDGGYDDDEDDDQEDEEDEEDDEEPLQCTGDD